jgi:hypothetical protein
MDWVAGSVAGFLRPALLLAGGTKPESTVTERAKEPDGLWGFDYELRYAMK